jgi:hypothetical protein
MPPLAAARSMSLQGCDEKVGGCEFQDGIKAADWCWCLQGTR